MMLDPLIHVTCLLIKQFSLTPWIIIETSPNHAFTLYVLAICLYHLDAFFLLNANIKLGVRRAEYRSIDRLPLRHSKNSAVVYKNSGFNIRNEGKYTMISSIR